MSRSTIEFMALLSSKTRESLKRWAHVVGTLNIGDFRTRSLCSLGSAVITYETKDGLRAAGYTPAELAAIKAKARTDMSAERHKAEAAAKRARRKKELTSSSKSPA
jgi:hypothetical protein